MRVLLADDHMTVRMGLRLIVENQMGWRVCGEAVDGADALRKCRSERPDIAIVDVSLPVLDGIVLIRALRRDCPSTRVVLFTLHDDEQTLAAAIMAGVYGYVLKSDSGDEIETALLAASNGERYFSTEVVQLLALETAHRSFVDRKRPSSLSPGRNV